MSGGTTNVKGCVQVEGVDKGEGVLSVGGEGHGDSSDIKEDG